MTRNIQQVDLFTDLTVVDKALTIGRSFSKCWDNDKTEKLPTFMKFILQQGEIADE